MSGQRRSYPRVGSPAGPGCFKEQCTQGLQYRKSLRTPEAGHKFILMSAIWFQLQDPNLNSAGAQSVGHEEDHHTLRAACAPDRIPPPGWLAGSFGG